MPPLLLKEGSFVDTKEASVYSVKDTVKVTARFVGNQELLKLTDSDWQNPFASRSKSLYTVFELIVENSGQDKISVDPNKCVLLDGLGHQYGALPDSFFKDLYPLTTAATIRKSQLTEEYQAVYSYTDDYYRRNAADKSIFKPMDLFPGVKQKGFVVFESVGREAPVITLIFPGVITYKENIEMKKMDFKFKFEQKVTIEQVIQ